MAYYDFIEKHTAKIKEALNEVPMEILEKLYFESLDWGVFKRYDSTGNVVLERIPTMLSVTERLEKELISDVFLKRKNK